LGVVIVTQKEITEKQSRLQINREDCKMYLVESGLELLDCLNKMWKVFVKIANVEQKEEVEEFIEAKERAHEIISKMAGGCDGN